ncbi:MAG: mechanosensitive ion channel family protein [Solirubrobacterales bacterium]|nr:mechanosensitive ion channel family protein [Solirubrobacterales bacterium]
MALRKKNRSDDGEKGADRARPPMPKWMFETRTEQWHEAGLGDEIRKEKPGRTWPRLLLFALLIAAVLVAFNHRQTIAPGYGSEARILTAILLFGLGLGFAGALGRTTTPMILRRMDPGTAGTIAFVIRLLTIVVVGVIALRIAGVKAAALAVGGAFTAVIVGLAAQQTLGNIFAGIVLQSTRPYKVGERVRLTSSSLAGSVEGTVSSLGLFYTTILNGPERMMIPNSVLLTSIVEPLRSPDSVDIRARFDSHVTPAEVQNMLGHAISVPLLEAPEIWLEEVDRDEVVFRITATPARKADGRKLAEEVVSVTRGTFEYPRPDRSGRTEEKPEQKNAPDPDVPSGHA